MNYVLMNWISNSGDCGTNYIQAIVNKTVNEYIEHEVKKIN